MINNSNKLIECRTISEGNRIYWERAIGPIDSIVQWLGVPRSINKPWRFLDGNLYQREDDRDRIGFGRYVDGKFERGLLMFDEYIINESDIIPQGVPNIENIEIDEVHNDLSSDTTIIKNYTTSQSFTVSRSNSFNASFGLELEQHWEAKATAGGEAYGGSVEASTGGSIKVSTNFGWEKSVSDEKMEGKSESTEIPIPIPAGKYAKIFRKHIKQDILIRTQLIGVLRPAFFIVDWKGAFSDKMKGNHDARKWKKTQSRVIMEIRGVEDLYDLLTGNNARYPNQTEDLIKKIPAIKRSWDFFADKDNRSFVQLDERLMRDSSATQIFLKEMG